ncbi:uncharacterized protein LOC111328543 [Stylophora pistillata]|uniref:uncharacterized protein LOC111328543 n=1 Tax=Stylophora pistillata TaxID=50429 RepID=UPI000C044CC1|nr:uncharacterized protein LOC111328543 [Stylophora pistillata]
MISGIILPLICTAGIISLTYTTFFPSSLFIPFLLFGKATSDVVLILREWERHRVPSLEHRVSSCVTRTGFLSASSALCGASILIVAIKSSFDVISSSFVMTAIAFIVFSIASFIGTVTLLICFESRVKELKTSCLWCRSTRSTLPYQGDFRKKSAQRLQNFAKQLAKKLTSKGGKVLALAITAGIVIMCVGCALHPFERTKSIDSLHQNHNSKKFAEEQRQFFGKETDISIVVPDEVEYSKNSLQTEITSMCKMLGEASYSEGIPQCWMTALLQWAKTQHRNCSDFDFYSCLEAFLDEVHGTYFRQDLVLRNEILNPRILASRVHLQIELHDRYREDRRVLEKLREDLATQSSLNLIAYSEKFLDLDDMFLLEKDTILLLSISIALTYIISTLSSTSSRIGFLLAITFGVLLLETAALMALWTIFLNQISFIVLMVTVVLSLGFNFQIAHAFVFSEKQAIRDRMIESFSSIWYPVLVSVLIAGSGSVSLGFIYPGLSEIFLQVVPVVLVLGLMHAFIILPPLIVLFLHFLDDVIYQNSYNVLPEKRSKVDGISLHSLDDRAKQNNCKRPGISIVGIGCRFPGASNKDQFWILLEQGKSSIDAFPRNRTEEYNAFAKLYHPKRFVSGRLCAVRGSYLEEIQNFDNKFFGISNQEARGMDPQQRILLQVVYEAIEDAGMLLEDLQRCKTGVFVGVMNLEYSSLITDSSNYRNIDQFSSTGITASIIANRVSFCLNLTGPSVAVDTACSSSLTALKLACDNLHNGDCDVAIVCAPNVLLNHAMQMVSSMAGLLAPDGRCKSFDASGDGYGRGEGFAAVILKLSNAAVSDKDDQYCEILACGMNNDGQNAVPMTAPSAKIQAQLSRMVLEQSGLAPEDVDYFEAHGTGTAIGDVVEVTSIADTYTRGTGILKRKLRVGSVKSNLNHTESTSGLAGLIKVALMIKNKRLVPTVNVHVLNPKLKLEEKGLVLQQTSEPWCTEIGKPRTGAVNSFGYGGSNVHAILREVTLINSLERNSIKHLNHVLTLSARSKEALQKMARHYSEWLRDHTNDRDENLVPDLCYSLNERRSQCPHRLAVAFSSTAEASKSLADYADDSPGWNKAVMYGEVDSSDSKIVYMFGGQGSQWYAMGRQLIETERVFREAILTVNNEVKALGVSWSLMDELLAPAEDKSRVSESRIAQPATFAVQYATARLLMSWRIFPSAVIGHSLGEFAAACIAGIITVKEAVELIFTRSTLQENCPNSGGMAALGLSEENARSLLMELRLSATLDVAAVNDGTSVTVSGDSQSIEALGEHVKNELKGAFWRVLGTKRAFHSSHMEIIKKPFQAAMKRLNFKPQLSKIPIYSTVRGDLLSGEKFDKDYWWQNIRCPVEFYSAIKHLLKDGHKQIIEISTQPILAHYVKQIALQEGLKEEEMPVVVTTLPRKRVPVPDQHKSFMQTTVRKLYTQGFPIDWKCVQENPSAKFVRSISYPWQEKNFWYREHPPQEIIPPLSTENIAKKPAHPYLGQVKMTDPYSGLFCWETEIDLHRFSILKDHALIQGGTVMPGAAYLEMAFAMLKDKFVGVSGLELRDVKLSSLLTLPDTQVRSLRLRLMKSDRVNEAKFHITSVQDDQSEINLSSGMTSIDLIHRQDKFEYEAPDGISSAVTALMDHKEKMPMDRFRQITENFGFKYGPNFSIIKQIWQSNNEGLCLLDISESSDIQSDSERFVIHPSILDACLQSCFVPLGTSSMDDKSIVPVGFKSVTLSGVPSTNQMYCHVTAKGNEFGKFDVRLLSPSGKVLLTMSEFRIAELTSSPRQLAFSELAYEVKWKEDSLEGQLGNAQILTCIVLKDSSSFSDSLVTRLEKENVNVITIDPPSERFYNKETEDSIKAEFSNILPGNSSTLSIVNLWPIETTLLPDSFEVIGQAEQLAFSSSVFLLQLLLEKDCFDSRLFLVTESTQTLDSCHKSTYARSIPWSSTVWGLRRTANLEEVNVRVSTVDLSNRMNVYEVDLLAHEIICGNNENEVAFRDGKRFVNRLFRADVLDRKTVKDTKKKLEDRNSLCISTMPPTGKLCLRDQSISRPSPSELTLEVLHCWIPSENLCDITKPNDCVFVFGKVTYPPEENKHNFKVGDEVCGVAPSGRISHSMYIQANNVFPKPRSFTTEQATCLPPCLAIAFKALQTVERRKENEKILIHEANRGPGLAAVVLAKALGFKVFCTVSDICEVSARATLLKLGADSVISQSSYSLNDDSTEPFDGVVFFYPPSSNALLKSSRCIRSGGHVAIFSSCFHGDVVFPGNTNIKYERDDVAEFLLTPLVYRKLSSESMKILESQETLEKLQAMEITSLDLGSSIKVVNASKYQQNRRPQFESFPPILIYSFGSFEEDALLGIPVLPRGLDVCGLKRNRTYLIAGGMRGFGFEVASWMAENGAKSVAVIGRSKPSDAKLQEIRQLESRTGAKIHTFRVDISNPDQMASLEEQLNSLPNVAGIVHTAMVLRDEFIKDLTFESFSEVMGPKIKGSFLLHQMSLSMDLDFFVMFSSMASIVGNMGQSSYSSCNAFQDSLAHYRRHVLGLPGLAINWGPISGAGVMERESGIVKLLTMAGLGFINAKEGVKHMAKVLMEDPGRCQLSLFDADWPRFIKSNPGLRASPRLLDITAEISGSDSQDGSTESLAQKIILEKDAEKRAELVNEYVASLITEWTGISSPSETDLNKSLYSYGADSTASLTLKMQLESNLQISFEVFYFMQPDTTPLKMAKDIIVKLAGQSDTLEAASQQPEPGETQESVSPQTQGDATDSGNVSRNQIQVVPLHTPAGAAVKFFCIHPSHRYALSLVPISSGFQGQDLIAFYALGFTDPTVVSEDWGSVRELATRYVQLIVKEQRCGPYFLGGYSYGGLLAYEIASLLTEQSQRVEFLAMIDTFPWSPLSRVVSPRLSSTLDERTLQQPRHIKIQFDKFLKKLALDTLKMTSDEYQQLT